MNLADIPFANLLGLKPSADDYIFELDGHVRYTNHLNTVAAAAQFSLAEVASGQWLLNHFPDLAAHAIPMLRKSNVRFRTPAVGRIRARTTTPPTEAAEIRARLLSNRRTTCVIHVEVVTDDETITMQGDFEWFLMLK